MRKTDFAKKACCFWAMRFEIIGIILLLIGVILTISTGNGLGIIALFAAGVILCLFNKFCCYAYPYKNGTCSVCGSCHADHGDDLANEITITKAQKDTTAMQTDKSPRSK